MAPSSFGAAGILRDRLAGKLGILFLMYISQKIFLTFSWTLLPVMLRQKGVSLGLIGFSALAYSPWALKFLWAPLVDRFYSPGLGRRKSWILPLLCTAWGLQLLLALVRPMEHLGLVLTLIFILNLLFATADIAVDGYATDILKPGERPWGNTIQMTGYMLGYMTGAGVLLMVYDNLGWTRTLFLAAILQMVLIAPVLVHREVAPVCRNTVPASQAGGLRKMAREPGTLWFILLLVVFTVCDQGGSHLRVPMFADLGISPGQVGTLNLWIGTPISIAGTFLGGILIRRLGVKPMFMAGLAGGALVSLVSALIPVGWDQFHGSLPWPVPVLVGLDKLVIGVTTVLICSMIMDMSAGPRSATRYAALSSVGHLAGFAVMPLAGMLCDRIGYTAFFSGMALAGAVSVFLGGRILKKLNLKYETGKER